MTTPLRLLIVEDIEADAILLEWQLRSGGYTVSATRVASAAQMIAALDRQEWDLVISDYHLPGFSAESALRLVQERGLDLPFIILSGVIDQATALQMMDAGAKDFIVKGDVARLLLAIARELREVAEQRARRVTEEALRTSRAHLELALGAARMVAWEWDPLNDVITTTDNFADIYGMPRIEMVAQGFALVHPDDVARHGLAVQRAVETAGSYHSEFRVVRPDTGQTVWLEERGQTLTDATGAVCKLTGVVMDITERKRMEQEAINALSTPVLQLRERLLILPITGTIDQQRAQHLTGHLLRSIRTNRSKVVVIDITGVPVVDMVVANHLVQTAEASRLLGAHVIITGLSLEVARTLVTLGVDLRRMDTMGDLQDGIEKAERLLGYEVKRPSTVLHESPQSQSRRRELHISP